MALGRTLGTSLSVAAILVLAVYPLLVYATIGRFGPSGVAAILAAVCLVRLVLLRASGRASLGGPYLELLCVAGVVLAAVSFWLDSAGAVLYYPVLVNAALLLVFAASLVSPPSVIERIARLSDPALPPAAVVYTRRVTVVWAVFFVLNGAAAFYTARFTSIDTWALYNGLIAYVLMAALFGIELGVRKVVRARLAR